MGRFSTWAWPEGLPPGEMTTWATATATGDLNEIPFPAPRPALEKVAAGDDCLGLHCKFYTDCWYYRARERWRQADVLVTNHALLLTDLTRPLGLLEGAGDRPLLLVCDEAHQLESYAVTARSADVTRRALRWAEELAPDLIALGDEFTQAVAGQYVEWHSDRVIPAGDAILEGADLVTALRDLASDFWSGSQPPSDPADAERYAHAVRLRNLAQRVKDVSVPTQAGCVRHVAHLPERRGNVTDAIVIANTAWQVSDLLAQLPQRAASLVYCSATLATGLGPASLGFFERSVGLGCAGVAPTELIVGSPFDYDRQGLLYLPLPGRLPADPNAPDYALACAREMAALVRLAGGRALCLFTAYTALRQAAEAFGQWAPEITVLQQRDELSRDAILACFREAQGRGQAILGTKSFWEGVSLEGDQLTLVAVDRVPFAPPGPVQLAKQADLVARGRPVVPRSGAAGGDRGAAAESRPAHPHHSRPRGRRAARSAPDDKAVGPDHPECAAAISPHERPGAGRSLSGRHAEGCGMMLRDIALQYHAWGANVTAIGGARDLKRPAHKWRQFTTARQTVSAVRSLPWAGYARRDGTRVDITGIGFISGVNGWRDLDFDKAPILRRWPRRSPRWGCRPITPGCSEPAPATAGRSSSCARPSYPSAS